MALSEFHTLKTAFKFNFELIEFYKNKKILVTGVTGFKGAWLSQWLISLGAKVYGLGYNLNQNKNLFFHRGTVKHL